MSDPTGNFSSDLDPYRLLAQMYGGGLFGSSASPSWSDYVRAQYMPDPSLAAALASDVPGFHKSPAVLEALVATDPRPPGFYRSPALLGASAMVPSLSPGLPSDVGPPTVLLGGSSLSADPNISLPSGHDYPMAWSSAPTAGFYPSPSTVGSEPSEINTSLTGVSFGAMSDATRGINDLQLAADNQRQNKMVRDIAVQLRLSPDQVQALHREISGQGLGYHEILERAKDMFGK